MQPFAQAAARNLMAVREKRPLIHNITNYVVMNFTANALLAMGAAPVMAHALGEVEEMVTLAGALVLNIGTLTEEWVEAMIRAGKQASRQRIPIILDPVGAGATGLRTRSAQRILAETRFRSSVAMPPKFSPCARIPPGPAESIPPMRWTTQPKRPACWPVS